MIIGMPCAIAVGYGVRPGLSAVADAEIVTTWLSVFCVAAPIPGKCFIAGTVPPDSRPVAKASDSVAVAVAPNDQVRPCWYMNDAVEDGTSATGARFELTPAQASARPVAAPCSRAVAELPAAPI